MNRQDGGGASRRLRRGDRIKAEAAAGTPSLPLVPSSTSTLSAASSPRCTRNLLRTRSAVETAPESTLVPGHAGESVAVDGVEVVVIRHVVREDLGVDHVALALLARLVHGLWGGKGRGTRLTSSKTGRAPPS